MVYHSIPTIIAYIAFFYIIHKNWLTLYVRLLYIVFAIYMAAATVCLGYSAGFHLYCMSLVPLVFYSRYLGHKIHMKQVRALPISFALVAVYLASSVFAILHGPVYELETRALFGFMLGNAIGVFAFLIAYSYTIHEMVIATENQLSEMANTDQLSGLYNRHYMIDHMETFLKSISSDAWVAMVDVDDFKKINDRYGHACGDYVLVELCRIMREVCGGCVLSRWGGEEFLISADGRERDPGVLETLRHRVEQSGFIYQGQKVAVTITVGMSHYQAGQTLDHWIQDADDKLYDGKKGGKNRVIY